MNFTPAIFKDLLQFFQRLLIAVLRRNINMKKSKKLALGIIFLVLVAAGAYNVYSNQGVSAEKKLNKALKSGKPVLLYFHLGGCAGCIEQEEILDGMESEHGGRVMFVRADFAENQEMFKEYAGLVWAFPVIVVFDSDGAVVERYAGVTEQDELERALSLN
jgi:thiol-disulfide isomerase/thioredoxin